MDHETMETADRTPEASNNGSPQSSAEVSVGNVEGNNRPTLDTLLVSLYAKYDADVLDDKGLTPQVSRADIDALEKQLLESHHEATKWTIERGVKLLTHLRSQFDEQMKTSKPRPKFKFLRHQQPMNPSETASPNSPTVTASHLHASVSQAYHHLPSSTGTCLRRRSNETLVFGPGSLRGTDVTLEELDGCLVILHDSIGALRGRQIHKSFIIASNVESSSIFYTVQDSVFLLKSSQLRIHETQSTVFLSDTTTPPIIEKSSGIRFGHLPSLSRIVQPNHEENHRFQKEIEVKDFNWHRQAEKSPNWELLKDDIAFDTEGELLTLFLKQDSSGGVEGVIDNKKQNNDWMITTQSEAKLRTLFGNLQRHLDG